MCEAMALEVDAKEESERGDKTFSCHDGEPEGEHSGDTREWIGWRGHRPLHIPAAGNSQGRGHLSSLRFKEPCGCPHMQMSQSATLFAM